MVISIMKSCAVILGALAFALLLFEYLSMRGRKANRNIVSQRLRSADGAGHTAHTPYAGKHGQMVESNDTGDGQPSRMSFKGRLRKMLSGIPFFARSFKREEQKRLRFGYRFELPKMLEIIALGMRV